MADVLFAPFADRLLGCFCAQWEVDDPDKPARCCFKFGGDTPTMGIAVNEDECKCGTAWVRVVDWYITSDAAFPGPDESPAVQRCPFLWALVLEMGIGRCPPAGNENRLPTCEEQNALHTLMLEDAAHMRQAVHCCFLAVDPLDEVIIGSPSRQGPQGLCMVQTLQITVKVTACDEC